MATPHKCPVCDGSGKVQRPPWVAGDQETWLSASTDTYPCSACTGSGVLWREDLLDPHAGCTSINPCSSWCPAGLP